ncbi:MAG: hypothetical protein M4579_004438 [Chaenotheca gracillima]|nr:MAG: hypothetical protein M4579_004438 [Chaenotheca gracillima]
MTRRTKKVAIIGGGPSGLVAAKTFLHDHPPGTFEPTIFEQSGHIGGLWPLDDKNHGGLMNPQMPTNLSKYTCSFSDLAWESVNLGKRSSKDNGFVPMFPRACEMGQYIKAYREKYVPIDTIRFNTKVTSAVRQGEKTHSSWHISWASQSDDSEHNNGSDATVSGPTRDASGTSELSSGHFDFLVIASGFFAVPNVPDLPGIDSFGGNVIHSSQFRQLDDLSGQHATKGNPVQYVDQPPSKKIPDGNIVVIGGSISGAENAASIAFQLSSARHSPNSGSISRSRVFHVVSHPFWTVPQMLPTNPKEDTDTAETNEGTSAKPEMNPKPSFLPLDVAMYELSRRPPGPITTQFGSVPVEKAQMINGAFETLIGSDQSDLGNGALKISGKLAERPLFLATSDSYAEFVRSGDIVPVIGALKDVKAPANGLKVETRDGEVSIDDVGCVVLATGFNPFSSLEFLSKDILQTLEIDYDCKRMPVLLENIGLRHPSIPDLGFVGYYQGPYWGIMEMQARALADAWTQDSHATKLPADHENSLEKTREFRRNILDDPDRIAQFVMGDYVGPMEVFSEQLGLSRYTFPGQAEREGPIVPARYVEDASAPPEEALKTLISMSKLLSSSRDSGHLVAKAAFRALHGKWRLSRELKSAISSFPSGTFTGQASFHPRQPTHQDHDAEYLYVEEGELQTTSGMTLKGSRKYVYRYREDLDQISAWFVKTGSEEETKIVDYLFHKLDISNDQDSAFKNRPEGWIAKGGHLCVEDQYDSEYLFRFRAVSLEKFRIRYTVKGPKKDYTSEAWYNR